MDQNPIGGLAPKNQNVTGSSTLGMESDVHLKARKSIYLGTKVLGERQILDELRMIWKLWSTHPRGLGST